MGVLSFLFRVLLILLVIRLAGIALRAFLGGYLRGARGTNTPARPGPRARESGSRGEIEELVKDPVCGVHTARSSAIAGTYEGRAAYFCSPECATRAAA